MALQIRQDESGTLRVLTLGGRLDTETAADLELAMQDLLGAGERDFLIDLGGIGYVSSAGLRVLLGVAKQLDGGRGSLRLCRLSPAVQQVFDVAGFTRLFAIFPNREAALGAAPKAEASVVLARKAAQLLRIARASNADPRAVELARAAASLLGIKPAVAGKAAASMRTPVPMTAFERQRSAGATAQSTGFMAMLRRWFGGRS